MRGRAGDRVNEEEEEREEEEEGEQERTWVEGKGKRKVGEKMYWGGEYRKGRGTVQ